MSGRFPTEYLARHWSNNKDGFCTLPTCIKITGDIEHLLTTCPALDSVRKSMWNMMDQKTSNLVPLNSFMKNMELAPSPVQTRFLLEPFAFNELWVLACIYGESVCNTILYCVRTFVYYLFREKQVLLGNWSAELGFNNSRRN